MKSHPHIRKTVKWGGAVVTVLLVVVWMGSARWTLRYATTRGDHLWIGDSGVGVFDFGGAQPRQKARWRFAETRWAVVWRPYFSPRAANAGIFFLPFWLLTGTAFAATVVAWRLDAIARRRERAHLCPKCRYDRTGLAVGAVCPECGVGSDET